MLLSVTGSICNHLKAINENVMNETRHIVVESVVCHCPLCSKFIVAI